jgi:hypothetical protein
MAHCRFVVPRKDIFVVPSPGVLAEVREYDFSTSSLVVLLKDLMTRVPPKAGGGVISTAGLLLLWETAVLCLVVPLFTPLVLLQPVSTGGGLGGDGGDEFRAAIALEASSFRSASQLSLQTHCQTTCL